MFSLLHRQSRARQISLIVLGCSLIALWCFRGALRTSWALASLPLIWANGASDFLISQSHDDFDVTFAKYSQALNTSEPQHDDLVPPVLHHIALGRNSIRPVWRDAMQACLDWHPGWDSYLWTDENARDFVAAHFPDLLATWDGYRYPVQRVDALRYMALYEYGGVILDMDLKCKRSLGPLRRFDFVAPAAHPTGFSIGFMMASRHNEFVHRVVQNLKTFNYHWLGLPYPTVMFSTGCHFASTIHALESNRTTLKILAGPADDPKLHKLNGPVSTPLFDHLGSSSWHSYDASLIVRFGKIFRIGHRVMFVVGFLLAFWFVWRRVRGRGIFKWRIGRQGKTLYDEGDWRV